MLDPLRPLAAAMGPVLAFVGLVISRLRRWRLPVVPVLLAFAFAATALARPEFRADAASYFAPLRSLTFDHDLDLADEWAHWGYRDLPLTETGLRRSVHPIGPALVWSPFYALAHAYVRIGGALGFASYPADGYSAPYRGAAALGTVTAVVLAATLLARMLATTVGPPIAVLAVATAVFASPVVYYTFVLPAMAHGPAFAGASVLVCAWERAQRAPSRRAWTVLGAALGAACLMRWQATVYLLLVAPLAIAGLATRTVRAGWLALSASAATIVFVPQMLVWWRLYGRALTVPQGPRFLDWSSSRWLDTLVSADHGLFAWTPALALGALGLLVGLRAAPLLHGGALAVLFATAWVNGAVYDWAAGDAFGARRYDVVIPLLAVGLAALLARARPWLARHPLFAPAALLAGFMMWNLGFMMWFRQGRYRQAAPLERVAADQARGFRLLTHRVLGRIAGPRAAALVYKALSAEYLYTSFNPGGTIQPADDTGYLLSGWGGHGRREQPVYRWALFPEACLRLPLEAPVDLQAVITARAAPGTRDQVMTLALNGNVLGAEALAAGWRDVRVLLPARAMVPGENRLCFRFSSAGAGEEGTQAAAAIARVQLP